MTQRSISHALTKKFPTKSRENILINRFNISNSYQNVFVGRDSSVGIAIRYELDSPGIEVRCGRDFPHPSRPALGPIQQAI